MNDSLVSQFGAPDAPFCDPTTARVTIIPAPLEYSVCYMKGTEHGPQAILKPSSKMEWYDEELDGAPFEVGIFPRQRLDYGARNHATAPMPTAQLSGEVLNAGQPP